MPPHNKKFNSFIFTGPKPVSFLSIIILKIIAQIKPSIEIKTDNTVIKKNFNDFEISKQITFINDTINIRQYIDILNLNKPEISEFSTSSFKIFIIQIKREGDSISSNKYTSIIIITDLFFMIYKLLIIILHLFFHN